MPDDRLSKYNFYTREFLNWEGYHSIAFVHAYASKDDGYGLTIADCEHQISISIDGYSEGAWNNSLNKLIKLETAIRALRIQLNRDGKRKGYKLTQEIPCRD